MKETRSFHFNGHCTNDRNENGLGRLSRNGLNNSFNGFNGISSVGNTLNCKNSIRIMTWSSNSIAKWSMHVFWRNNFWLWNDMNWSKSFAWASFPITTISYFVSMSIHPLAFSRCLKLSPECNHSNTKLDSAIVTSLTNWWGGNWFQQCQFIIQRLCVFISKLVHISKWYEWQWCSDVIEEFSDIITFKFLWSLAVLA